MAKRPADYDRSVFVNCPFDEQYRPLFRALLFTIQVCGFRPRCALEVDDSGQTRVSRIIDLVRDSRYGIHDLSRTELSGGLPRFNMPFELGLFIGFKYAGAKAQREKRALVLDREPYRYQRLLSDMAGQDPKAHQDDTRVLIRVVRDWLASQANRDLPGAALVSERYDQFVAEAPRLLDALGKTEAELENYADLARLTFGWIEANVPAA